MLQGAALDARSPRFRGAEVGLRIKGKLLAFPGSRLTCLWSSHCSPQGMEGAQLGMVRPKPRRVGKGLHIHLLNHCKPRV